MTTYRTISCYLVKIEEVRYSKTFVTFYCTMKHYIFEHSELDPKYLDFSLKAQEKSSHFLRAFSQTCYFILKYLFWLWANKCSKHVEALNRNKLKANGASCWPCYTEYLISIIPFSKKVLSIRPTFYNFVSIF
jgi:hypothetical protein